MPRGASTYGDLLTQLSDGTDLNVLWDEFQAALEAQNAGGQILVQALTYDVTTPGETVLQTTSGELMEEASEFGLPKALRPSSDLLKVGFTFNWFDVGTRATWKFLADASRQQVESLHNQALSSDNSTTYFKVMQALYNPAQRANAEGAAVYGLYNGTDGVVPPSYGDTTFDGTHSHYLVAGANSFDSGDLDTMIANVTEHGYGTDESGSQLILLANPVEARIIRRFRAGAANNNGALAINDFVPSDSAPPFWTAETLQGSKPPANVNGLKIIGQYGPALIHETTAIPAGYPVLVATGGAKSALNPIGFREHSNPALRGLRQIPGDRRGYPLLDSYYSRGFGTGVRHRGAAVVMQVKASGSYTPPAKFAL